MLREWRGLAGRRRRLPDRLKEVMAAAEGGWGRVLVWRGVKSSSLSSWILSMAGVPPEKLGERGGGGGVVEGVSSLKGELSRRGLRAGLPESGGAKAGDALPELDLVLSDDDWFGVVEEARGACCVGKLFARVMGGALSPLLPPERLRRCERE